MEKNRWKHLLSSHIPLPLTRERHSRRRRGLAAFLNTLCLSSELSPEDSSSHAHNVEQSRAAALFHSTAAPAHIYIYTQAGAQLDQLIPPLYVGCFLMSSHTNTCVHARQKLNLSLIARTAGHSFTNTNPQRKAAVTGSKLFRLKTQITNVRVRHKQPAWQRPGFSHHHLWLIFVEKSSNKNVQ